MKECTIDLLTDGSDLPDYRDAFECFAATTGLSLRQKLRLNLVLDELVSNIVHHGLQNAIGRSIRLVLNRRASGMEIMLTDDAAPFDPFASRPDVPDLPLEEQEIGGLGLRLVDTLAINKNYRRDGDFNVVALTLPLIEPAASDDGGLCRSDWSTREQL